MAKFFIAKIWLRQCYCCRVVPKNILLQAYMYSRILRNCKIILGIKHSQKQLQNTEDEETEDKY